MKSQVTLLLLIAAIIFAHAYGQRNDTVKPAPEKPQDPVALTTLMVGKKPNGLLQDSMQNSRTHAFIPVN